MTQRSSAAKFTGPTAVFKLPEKYTRSSVRIPAQHQSAFTIPAGRVTVVLPTGADVTCTIYRLNQQLRLRNGWSAISDALQLGPGSTVRLQQERFGGRRFHIAKLRGSAAAAPPAGQTAAQQRTPQPAPSLAAATAAPPQPAAAPSPEAAPRPAAATGSPAQRTAAAEAEGAAVLRVKLPEGYEGHSCVIPQSLRHQLEALLPGPPDSRPLTLLLPNGKQVAVVYRLQSGRILKGWQAVHLALQPRAKSALYFWRTAPGRFRISKQRPSGSAASSHAAGPSAAAAGDVPQQTPPRQPSAPQQVTIRAPVLLIRLTESY